MHIINKIDNPYTYFAFIDDLEYEFTFIENEIKSKYMPMKYHEQIKLLLNGSKN